ncbi:MFS transporter [Haloglycomyces albus]|uniref:MFS transporter n=1 Tax=Haloglycomyces albus TaxID=526067 RepID=UPI00046D7CC5|nr:MFS transporter [Haloglycomyces albus]
MNRDLRTYLLGQTSSVYGATVVTFGIPLIAVGKLGATPFEVGLLTASSTVPMLFLGLLIATWTDRLRRKRPALIACDLGSAAIVALAGLYILMFDATLWLLIAVNLGLAVVGVAIESLYFSHLKSIVSDDGLMAARARLQGGEQTARVFGQGTSSPLVALSTSLVFIVDTITSVLSALALSRIRTPEVPTERPSSDKTSRWSSVFEGFRVLRENTFLRWYIAYTSLQSFVTGITRALMALLILTVIGVSEQWYSLMFIGVTAAAFSGTVIVARWCSDMDPRKLTVFTAVGMAVSVVLLPAASGPFPVAVAILIIAISTPALLSSMHNIGITTFITKAVDEDKLGRFIVTLRLVTSGATLVGALAGGILGGLISIRGGLWTGAILSLCGLFLLRPLLKSSRDGHGTDVKSEPAGQSASQS